MCSQGWLCLFKRCVNLDSQNKQGFPKAKINLLLKMFYVRASLATMICPVLNLWPDHLWVYFPWNPTFHSLMAQWQSWESQLTGQANVSWFPHTCSGGYLPSEWNDRHGPRCRTVCSSTLMSLNLSYQPCQICDAFRIHLVYLCGECSRIIFNYGRKPFIHPSVYYRTCTSSLPFPPRKTHYCFSVINGWISKNKVFMFYNHNKNKIYSKFHNCSDVPVFPPF